MKRRIAAALFALAGLGCQGPTASEAPAPTFEAVSTRVFSNCTTRSCHSTLSRRGNLVLTPDMAYEMLVDVPADNAAAKAKGKLRVVPGKPDESFLVQKLTNPGPDEGARMPLTGGELPAEDLALLRAWIAAGAKP